MARRPLSWVKSLSATQDRSLPGRSRGHGLPIAAQSALGDVHVERPGDGGDLSTAPFQQVGDGAAGTADVVRVDVADVLLARTASQHHRRQPRLGEHVRQRVPGMHGHQQRPVDPAAPRVLQETLPLRIRTDQGQQQLHPGVRQRIPQRADDLGEERLRELPPVRLRQDQGHGIGPTPCQRPRGEIGHVPEFLDSTLHSPARRRLHTGRVVDDTRDRAPPHPRADGHLLQRRPPRTSSAHDHLPHEITKSYGPTQPGTQTSPAAWPNHRAPGRREAWHGGPRKERGIRVRPARCPR